MTSPNATGAAAAPSGSNPWTVAIFALIGLGLGLLVFALRTPTYEAEALVAVSNPVGTLADEAAVVTNETLLRAAESSLGFAPEVSVSIAEVAGLLTITATADTAQQAAEAANVVANTYVQAQTTAAASVAQAATVPDSATGVGPLIFALIGSALGAGVGFVVRSLQAAQAPRRARPEPAAATPDRADGGTPAIGTAAFDDGRTGGFDDPLRNDDDGDNVGAYDASPPDFIARSFDTHDPDDNTGGSMRSFDDDSDDVGDAIGDLDAGYPDQTPPTADRSAGHAAPFAWESGVVAERAPSPEDPTAGPFEFDDDSAGSAPGPSTDPASEPARPSSFADATSEPTVATSPLSDLERKALHSQFESARYELTLAHQEQLARVTAAHERQMAELRNANSELNKQLRIQAVRLKDRPGSDQHRVGDLEAQVDALEIELAALRQQLESERIAHARKLTEERGVADRSLDNARRQYREELAKHVQSHRVALSEHRIELDRELAADRAAHAEALETQHREYEANLEAERARAEAALVAATERYQRELAAAEAKIDEALDRQAAKHKDTISSLRTATERNDAKIIELEKQNRMLRAELSQQRQQNRAAESEHTSAVGRLRDELAMSRTELEGERERNAALRADVLRRSAEAHQVIDRAVEERTAQLAELEASVTRQREYADARVREISAAAEEQARDAATREANLNATISRLKRELDELRKSQTPQP